MSAPISVLTLELEKMLEARIQSAQAERVALRDELDKLDAQLKKAITAIGKRPAHTDAELTELARQKEYQHRTTNMSLMKEKEFIRELEGIRQKKKDLIEYNKKQLDIEGLKGTRATTSAELREKEELLDELFAGSRKLSVANTLKCNPADVVEKKITIPEDNMPRIIGKGGSGVKLLEETFSVVILSERAHVLRIMGLEHSVSMAYTAILLKASSVTEALNLHAALKACLLVGKAALTKEIEDRFEVTLNYSKTDNICKIFGQSAGVAGAKESILAINFSKFRVKVDPAMIPRLVGKGGANLRSMYDESLLQIDLLKEENVVAIYGLHEHAAPVAAAIKSFLEDNKEVSHVLTVPHFFLHNCIQSIGAIQKRGAFIDCTFGKNEEDCTITVRGGSSAAGEALQAVKQVLNDFEANTSTIEFHQSSIASVIGRKGETINKLRTEYPDVMIQLNGSSVSVHSVNRVVREAAMEAIRLIADAHYSETVKLNKDATISLKQSVGEATRIKLMSELNLGVNIDTEGETVRLVGRVADVEAGKLLLAAFATSAFTIELQISAEDASSVGSMLNDLEGDFGVRASLTNKRQLLRIVGTKANSTKAKAALLAILDGAPGSGAVMVRIDPLDIPGLIGNKGRNLEALERQLGVRIDVVKSRESVRIRGALDILDQARAGLLLALSDNAKVTETVTASRDLGVEAVGRCLGEVARLYGMELVIRLSDRVFSIKGKKELVDAAKAFLIESMAGLASTSIPLFENHGSALPPSRFILLAERCGVSIRLDGDLNALQVTGSPACLRLAVDEVYLLLCALFPLMYEALPVPQFCFADLSAFHYVNTLEKDHSIGIHLDRFMSKVYLRGDATSIRDAVSALGGKVAAWEELHEVLEGLDEAAISALLAKQGELLSGFERDTGCSVRLSRSPRCLVIEGNSKEEVTAAKELIANRLSVPSDSILATTSSSWEVEIHPDVIGSIIGKGGAIIKKLRSDTGASIDYDQDNAIIKVSGSEESVGAARAKLEEIVESKTPSEVAIPAAAMAFMIGAKGGNIKAMEGESGARIDMDKSRGTVVVRGTPESRDKAMVLVRERLAEGSFEELPAVAPAPKNLPAAKGIDVGLCGDFASEETAARNYNKEKRLAKQLAFKYMQAASQSSDSLSMQEEEGGLKLTTSVSTASFSSAPDVSKDAVFTGVSQPAAPITAPPAIVPVVSAPSKLPSKTPEVEDDINFFGLTSSVTSPAIMPVAKPSTPLTALPTELDANTAFLLNLLNSSTKSGAPASNPVSVESAMAALSKSSLDSRPAPSGFTVGPPGLDRTPSDDAYGRKTVKSSATLNSSDTNSTLSLRSGPTSLTSNGSSLPTSDKYFKSKSGFSVRL